MSCFQKQSTEPKMATPPSDPITIPSTKTTLSSFLSIGTSQPTTTTKLRKLLFKTIQKRNGKTVKNTKNGANDENNYGKKDKKKRKWSRPRVISSKRSSLKALFGNKKKESPFANQKEVSGNWEGKGKQPIGNDKDEKISKQSKLIYRKSIKVPTFLADFFDRKCSVNSTDALKRKLHCSSSITSRFPRFSFTNRDIEINNNIENEPVEESVGDGELCKKRILMGEKCKPLNSSGILHYDVNGLLLIED